MNIGDRIKHLRKEMNFTQQDLADKLYVSRAAISKWETGKGYPNIESLQDISSLFQISINDLLSNEELIQIAVESRKDNVKSFSLYGFSIFDLLGFTMMFFPLFANKVGDYYQSVSLFHHNIENIPIIITYYLVFMIYLLLFGVECCIGYFSLFQHKRKMLLILSCLFSVFSLFVFIITNEPYISFFITILLLLKAILLFNFIAQK